MWRKNYCNKISCKKYGRVLYNWEEQCPNYENIANTKYQPVMSQRKEITSWKEYAILLTPFLTSFRLTNMHLYEGLLWLN